MAAESYLSRTMTRPAPTSEPAGALAAPAGSAMRQPAEAVTCGYARPGDDPREPLAATPRVRDEKCAAIPTPDPNNLIGGSP